MEQVNWDTACGTGDTVAEPQERRGCLNLLRLFGVGRHTPSDGRERSVQTSDTTVAPSYRLRDNFMSPAEVSFFHVLHRVIDGRALIFPKVRLGDLIYAPKQEQQYAALQRINRKHVDFVLCDPRTLQPIAVIELDDRSHRREDRIDRDAFVESVFTGIGLPLLRFAVRPAYDICAVADEISRAMPSFLDVAGQDLTVSTPASAASTASTELDAVSSTLDTRTCERCGQPMVRRRATQGRHAGGEFWGCSNFPRCRNMVPISS
jgi:hypothetical protein